MNVVTFKEEALPKLLKGTNILGDVVSSTLGPKGTNVIIQSKFNTAIVTKDGVTVARSVESEDPIEALAINIIKQAASQTAKVAGDGTTTATLLAQSFVNEGYKKISNGTSPIDLKREMEKDLVIALEALTKHSSAVTKDDLFNIAKISANNDSKIADLITKGFNFVSKDGVITIENSPTEDTYVSTLDGLKLDRGYLSPYFINDPKKQEVVYDDPYILVTDKKIRSANEIVPILEQVSRTGKPLLIIADNVDGQALSLLIVNKVRMNLPLVAIQAPAYGDRRNEILKDIATATGAELISDLKSQSLEHMTLSQLGSASKIIISKDETIIVEGKANPEEFKQRLEEIKVLLSKADTDYAREKLTERYSKLLNKVAVIFVGASTEAELKEKKDRIDDALRATYSAVSKGVVKGGGATLLQISKLFSPSSIFSTCLQSPIRKIISNAGWNPDVVVNEINRSKSQTYGFDANNLTYVDLIAQGIIDPTLVIEQALKNATSAATMILLSAATIHDPSLTTTITNDFES